MPKRKGKKRHSTTINSSSSSSEPLGNKRLDRNSRRFKALLICNDHFSLHDVTSIEAEKTSIEKSLSAIKNALLVAEKIGDEYNATDNGFDGGAGSEFPLLIEAFRKELQGEKFFQTENDTSNYLFDTERLDSTRVADAISSGRRGFSFTDLLPLQSPKTMLSDLRPSCQFRIALCIPSKTGVDHLVKEMKKSLAIWGRIKEASKTLEQKSEKVTHLARSDPNNHRIQHHLEKIVERYPDYFEEGMMGYSDHEHGKCYARLVLSRLVRQLSYRNSYNFREPRFPAEEFEYVDEETGEKVEATEEDRMYWQDDIFNSGESVVFSDPNDANEKYMIEKIDGEMRYTNRFRFEENVDSHYKFALEMFPNADT
eukprot:g1420.t1